MAGVNEGSEPERAPVAGFVKFPRTPHLVWLGKASPRGDKLMAAAEAKERLEQPMSVEEKVDGANLGLSIRSRAFEDRVRGVVLRRALGFLRRPPGLVPPLRRLRPEGRPFLVANSAR